MIKLRVALSIAAVCSVVWLNSCSSNSQQKKKESPADDGQDDGCDASGDESKELKKSKKGSKGFALADEKTYYDPDIKRIMTENCTGCHGGTSPQLGTFDQVVAAADDSDAEIQSGKMPKGKTLSDTDKQLWSKWLTDGKLEKAEGDTTGDGSGEGSGETSGDTSDDTTGDGSGEGSTDEGSDTGSGSDEGSDEEEADPVTYYDDIQPLLKKYCVSCHSEDGEEKPYLDTYKRAKAKAKAIVTSIETEDEDKKMPPKKAKKTVKAADLEKFKAWSKGGTEEGEAPEEDDCE